MTKKIQGPRRAPQGKRGERPLGAGSSQKERRAPISSEGRTAIEMLPPYRVGSLLQLLAKDPRTNLLDVQIQIVGNRVFIAGSVESAVLRVAAEQVVREAIPRAMEIVNNLWVTTYVP